MADWNFWFENCLREMGGNVRQKEKEAFIFVQVEEEEELFNKMKVSGGRLPVKYE